VKELNAKAQRRREEQVGSHEDAVYLPDDSLFLCPSVSLRWKICGEFRISSFDFRAPKEEMK